MRKRLPELDDIRGISIIVMILIHTNAYFLSKPWAYTTREISQFAVVAFLFCSAYLSIQKPYPDSVSAIFHYFYKRLSRLLIPFYIFFVAYIVFMNLAVGKQYPEEYIMKSFLLIGGIDFNWLVLLFIQLMIVTPILQYLYAKKEKLLIMYSALAFVSSVVFLKYTPLPYYRSIMWLPWSLVIVYALYFERIWKNKALFFWVTFLFGALFLSTQQLILIPMKHSLSMYYNKYPPNLYHIAYSLFAINILYFLSRMKVFSLGLVQSVIHFFSINSYQVFFIHIIVIEGVWKFMRPTNWILFFVIVAYVSALVQMGFNWMTERLHHISRKKSVIA